jgi:hypothetical protein
MGSNYKGPTFLHYAHSCCRAATTPTACALPLLTGLGNAPLLLARPCPATNHFSAAATGG